MRVSPRRARAASRSSRPHGAPAAQHGFDGIGVADIMKAAGLTHGGFYRNFASKDGSGGQGQRTCDRRHDSVAEGWTGPTAQRSVSRTYRTLCVVGPSRRSRFRVYSARIGRGRRAERRPCSPRCLHHGNSRAYLEPDWETVVRDPQSCGQQTSRCYPFGNDWCLSYCLA